MGILGLYWHRKQMILSQSKMYPPHSNSPGALKRYSAKKSLRPANFLCFAPQAKHVSLIGDFNQWHPNANPMKRLPDGGWYLQIPLTHGTHHYLFLIDSEPTLDPRAQGTVKTPEGGKVSMIAIS